MNGASKILTVSYGTFSCTLEGFDDPFNTMKAIAEYFRDLAAEDRYFGAEPPTPDAAMLHRIAEREIQRRVEAKIQENGVVLRASETEAPTVAAPAVTVAPAPAPVAAPAPAPAVVDAAPAAAPSPVAPAAPSVAPADASATESVVAKLSRLRSEVAAQPGTASPVATMPTVSFAIPDYLEDEHAEVIESAPLPDDLTADLLPEEDASVAAVASDALPEDDPATGDDVLLAALSEQAALPSVEEEAVDDADTASDVTEEAIIAELADEADDGAEPQAEVDLPESLIAALADGTDDAEAASAADEDAAPAPAEAPFAGLSDLIAEAEVVEAEVAAAAEEPTAAYDDAEDEPAASLEQAEEPLAAMEDGYDAEEEALEAAFARTEEAPAEEPSTAPELRPGAAEKLQRARARVIRIRRGDDAPASAAPEAAPETEAEPAVEAEAPATPAPITPVRPRRVSAAAPQPAPETDLATEDEVDAPAAPEDAPVAAAVETPIETPVETPVQAVAETPVARTEDDFEANLSSIFAEVVEEEESRAPAKPAIATPAAVAAMDEAEEAVDGLLSAEDEAELMRELAALRTNEEDSPDGAAAGASAFVLQQEARKGFSGPTADEALGRLMKQTDSEMEGPENKRRQSAIAHLKAAVAATVAERKVTGDKPADTAGVSRLARYRNDLAMAVKSALPGRGGSEPPKDRPAPLVLVSEQRIDKPRPAPQAAPTPASAAPAAVQPVQPVRPRRVSASGSGLAMQAEAYDEDDADEDVGAVLSDTKGFGEFVDRVGAVTLEEILEASAAYLAGVEGLESFSRPQVMHHLGAVVPPGTFQREDGLRGFGTLLRNGRIAKLRRGQFVLSEDSPYLAEAKKIAG